MRGNFSTNYQISGRELMTPDEVRLLDNKYCITFIRGERPVLDYKYDILKHPNIELSHDGKAKAYVHGFMPEERVVLHDTPLDECIDITKDVETDMASEEARTYFNRIYAEYSALFSALGSRLEEVEAEEKLRIIFDFFHYGSEEDYHYDASRYEKRGYSFKDAIAPDSFEFRSDFFKMDGRYGRVLYLRDYANFIKDSFMAELTDIDRGLMLSIDASPITTDEAIRQSESKLLSVETNISNWQRKQNQNNNFSATIPYDMERQREESREFLNDLVARDQRMIPALMLEIDLSAMIFTISANSLCLSVCLLSWIIS